MKYLLLTFTDITDDAVEHLKVLSNLRELNIKVTGNANLTGDGVLVYHAGGSGINLSGTGQFDLTPLDEGPYRGVLIFQGRANANTISLSGSAVASTVTGTIYAAAAQLQLSGNAFLEASIIVDRLKSSGNAANNLQAVSGDGASLGAVLSEGQSPMNSVMPSVCTTARMWIR